MYNFAQGNKEHCSHFPLLLQTAVAKKDAEPHWRGQTRLLEGVFILGKRTYYQEKLPPSLREIDAILEQEEAHFDSEGALLQKAERLDLIARVTRQVVASAPLSTQMKEVAKQVRDAFAVDVCIIRALEADEQLHLLAVAGLAAEMVFESLPSSYGIAHEMISTRRPLAIEDVPLHPATAAPTKAHTWGFKFRSYAGAPLLVEDKVVGILGIYLNEQHRLFSETDLEHLQIVANHAAVALQNDRLYRAVEQQKRELEKQAAERGQLAEERERLLRVALERAERDPVTGVYNHHAFHNRLECEAKRALHDEKSGIAIALLDLDNFRLFNESYGHDAGDALLKRIADTLLTCCGPGDMLARVGADEFALLVPDVNEDSVAAFVERLANALHHLGFNPPHYSVEIPLHLAIGVALFPMDAPTLSEVLHLADERLRNSKQGEEDLLTRTTRAHLSGSVDGFSMLDALVTAVDNKDRYTRRHSEEVFHYATQIARELGLPESDIADLETAALLHDVGKIGVPNRLLRLPTRLTDEESEAMKQHPALGALLIAAAPGLAHLVPAVRHHHERWDGCGYPDGLQGEAIPLFARILAVADTFSAMTTDRPYRRGLSREVALNELEAGAGCQWDSACVAAFTRLFRNGEIAAPLSKFSP